MLEYVKITVGDPAPDFVQRSTSSERYYFNTAAGRYIVLCFFGASRHPFGQTALATLETIRSLFDDNNFAFFGVSVDPADKNLSLLKAQLPGIRYFWDFDGSVSRMYGALPVRETDEPSELPFRPVWYVLDPNLRVLQVFPFDEMSADATELVAFIRNLPALDSYADTPINAPVLIIPRVFEPEFCRTLIDLYTGQGGTRSGFMVERNGRTVSDYDEQRKRRKDFNFSDQPEYENLRLAVRKKVQRRIHPEVEKAFQFNITRLERYLVACYEGAAKGFFKAHRDNTTKGTAHRRFACTINLNPEEYDGGDLTFPEFGTRQYRAPRGGAVIFSCSLLHEAAPVTSGTRYAFVPFFYDEAARKIRDENAQFLDPDDAS